MNLSKLDKSKMLDIFRFLKIKKTSLINNASSLLPLPIEHLDKLTCSSTIGIVIIRGAWSDERH